MADRTVIVRLRAETSQYKREMASASQATGDLSKQADGASDSVEGVSGSFGSLKSAAVIGGAALAGAGLVQFSKDAIDAASSLEEMQAKSETVFGDAQDHVRDFAENAARDFNMSERAAYEAAAGFGQFFDAAGFDQGRAAEMSTTLAKLAGDLASFNDIEPSEAIEKLRSGLAGESEPLREVGVFLSDVKVQAKAVELGIADAGDSLTEGEKIAARYAIIMDETATAQGDVARTSDSLANRQRNLSAAWEDLQAALGREATPALATAIGWLTTLIDEFADANETIDAARTRLFNDLTDAPEGAETGWYDLLYAINSNIPGWEQFRELLGQTREEVEEVEPAAESAAEGVTLYTSSAKDSTEQSKLLNEALEGLEDAFDTLGGKQRAAVDADIAWQEAMAGLTETAEKRAEITAELAEAEQELAEAETDPERERARERIAELNVELEENALTLDLTTEAGRRNTEALLELAEATEAKIVQDATLGATQEDLRGSFDTAREAMILQAEQLGLTREQAEAYVDRILQWPEQAVTTVILYSADAEKQMEALIKKWSGRTITVKAIMDESGLTRAQAADAARYTGIAISGRRASGGPVWPGDWLVGEQGPEILRLGANGTGHVIPAAQTARMVGGEAGSSFTVQIGQVNYPVPEQLSKSIPDLERRAQFYAGRGIR